MVLAIISIILSYLIGAISFSFIIAKWLKGIDIRQHGSGNAGATNTLRVLGKGPAICVLMLDVGKGILAVWIGKWMGDVSPWIPVICGIAAIAGHNWPIYFHFKGGKGIATMIGVMATLAFLPSLFAGIVGIAAIVVTRYVSLGSLIFSALLPIMIIIMNRPHEILWASLLLCIFAFVRHRTNIVKIVQGKENKLGAKKGEKRVV